MPWYKNFLGSILFGANMENFGAYTNGEQMSLLKIKLESAVNSVWDRLSSTWEQLLLAKLFDI